MSDSINLLQVRAEDCEQRDLEAVLRRELLANSLESLGDLRGDEI